MPHGEMAKKTVLHRICKRLDLGPDARDAVDLVEGEYELGDTEALPPPERPTGDDGLSLFDDIGDKAPDEPGPQDKAEKAAHDAESARYDDIIDKEKDKVASDAAMLGHESLDKHVAQLPPDEVDALQPMMPDLRTAATAADLRTERLEETADRP